MNISLTMLHMLFHLKRGWRNFTCPEDTMHVYKIYVCIYYSIYIHLRYSQRVELKMCSICNFSNSLNSICYVAIAAAAAVTVTFSTIFHMNERHCMQFIALICIHIIEWWGSEVHLYVELRTLPLFSKFRFSIKIKYMLIWYGWHLWNEKCFD